MSFQPFWQRWVCALVVIFRQQHLIVFLLQDHEIIVTLSLSWQIMEQKCLSAIIVWLMDRVVGQGPFRYWSLGSQIPVIQLLVLRQLMKSFFFCLVSTSCKIQRKGNVNFLVFSLEYERLFYETVSCGWLRLAKGYWCIYLARRK